VVLIVSGGHTLLAHLADARTLQVLGQTRDDAAGEAFDKVARLLGLGFPGGPAIERAARAATGSMHLPRAWLRDSDDFSFSGLKTAVLHQVRAAGGALDDALRAELAAAFQESVVDVLVRKTCDAARRLAVGGIVLAGGVAANQRLRAALLAQAPVPVWVPPLALCTDNAAMIAAAAFWRQDAGLAHGLACDVAPSLRLGQV
jgi:N6-L-threonylcarbamoyladenine synthase